MPYPKRLNTIYQVNEWKDKLLSACGCLTSRHSVCPHLDDVIFDDTADCAIAYINQVIDDFKTLELKLIQLETLSKIDE